MTKKIKLFYFTFILIILVVVVSIVLYNVMQEDTDDDFSISLNINADLAPIVDPGPTNIVCSNLSDCTGVCVVDECLVPSCNKTTNTCICLGIC